MKGKFRLLIVLTAMLSVLLLPINAAADEALSSDREAISEEIADAAPDKEEIGVEIPTEEAETSNSENDTTTQSGEALQSGEQIPTINEEAGTDEVSNVFAELYGIAMAHLGEILSALSFIASLVIALAYKRGLAPLVSNTAERIGSSVKKLGEESERGRLEQSEIIKASEEKLAMSERVLKELSEKVEGLLGALKSEEELEALTRRVEEALRLEAEMMYDIFMCSQIPQYQKDALGEKIAMIKKESGSCGK